jgi:hypothetical protein
MIRSRLAITLATVTIALGVTASVAIAASPSQPPPPAPGAAAGATSQRSTVPSNMAQDPFTPLTPCRAISTNPWKPVPGSGHKVFYVGGAVGFVAQGGVSGGCGVPTNATAVSATVTAMHAQANGHLTLFAAGTTAPNTIGLVYSKGQSSSTGTTAQLTPGSGQQLAVKASSKTDVLIDILGY